MTEAKDFVHILGPTMQHHELNQVDDRHMADKEILDYLCFKSRAKYVSDKW